MGEMFRDGPALGRIPDKLRKMGRGGERENGRSWERKLA
jgi:hypothetical protein